MALIRVAYSCNEEESFDVLDIMQLINGKNKQKGEKVCGLVVLGTCPLSSPVRLS